MMRKNKSQYHKNLLTETSLNPEKFRKVIKDIFPTKGINKHQTINDETTNTASAEKFRNFFSAIVTSLNPLNTTGHW